MTWYLMEKRAPGKDHHVLTKFALILTTNHVLGQLPTYLRSHRFPGQCSRATERPAVALDNGEDWTKQHATCLSSLIKLTRINPILYCQIFMELLFFVDQIAAHRRTERRCNVRIRRRAMMKRRMWRRWKFSLVAPLNETTSVMNARKVVNDTLTSPRRPE